MKYQLILLLLASVIILNILILARRNIETLVGSQSSYKSAKLYNAKVAYTNGVLNYGFPINYSKIVSDLNWSLQDYITEGSKDIKLLIKLDDNDNSDLIDKAKRHKIPIIKLSEMVTVCNPPYDKCKK